jgi:hypothetical protein
MNFILLVRHNKKIFRFEYVLFLLKVIASAGDETHSDIHSGEESSGSSNDYTERRSLAITIPDYSLLEANDEKFYVSI